jgi:type VI secretion system protein ImpA
MPSPPLLEFDALLAPIAGDNPAGETVPFSIKEKLEEGRKEENPDEYAADDPMRPSEFKRADWPGIIRLAQETLKETSKDLLVAARLTEALTRQNGYAGLRDGLHLLCQLVETCWERVNPPIEEGDIEVRASPFVWLDVADRGARFPSTVRMVPLVSVDGASYSWIDWKKAQDGSGGISSGDFEKALVSTPVDQIQRQFEDLTQAADELNHLIKALTDKMAGDAPGMMGLYQSIGECRTLAKQILDRVAPGEAAPGEGKASAAGTGVSPGKAATSRAEAYRQLEQAARLLQQLEPHSPIPYLVQRACELGKLPFPLLIRALIREPNVLGELSREFGLKEDSVPAPGST